MELEFTKMHGAGNDFIFIDCLKKDVPNLGAVAGKLCDRRFGIGAGLAAMKNSCRGVWQYARPKV